MNAVLERPRTHSQCIGFTNHNGWLQPVQEEQQDRRTVWRIGHPGMVVYKRPTLSISYQEDHYD